MKSILRSLSRCSIVILLLLLMVALFSCVTMDSGANWFYADTDLYEENYKDFEIEKIDLGMPKYDLITALNIPYNVQSVTKEYEVLEFEKWRSVPGPDYVEERLLVKIEGDRVAEFIIVKDTVKTNPW